MHAPEATLKWQTDGARARVDALPRGTMGAGCAGLPPSLGQLACDHRSTHAARVSYFERDVVRRMIKQLGEIAGRIARLAAQRKLDEALSVVRQSEQELLGPLSATLDAVDANTVRLLLGNDEKLEVWIVLLTERAKLLDAQSQQGTARSVASRALELLQLLESQGARDSELLTAAGQSARALVAKAPPRTG
jgi:hypothetical protein